MKRSLTDQIEQNKFLFPKNIIQFDPTFNQEKDCFIYLILNRMKEKSTEFVSSPFWSGTSLAIIGKTGVNVLALVITG